MGHFAEEAARVHGEFPEAGPPSSQGLRVEGLGVEGLRVEGLRVEGLRV